MDEIIKMVATKTGMSEPVARTAVETVLNFLKTKLPPGLGNQLGSMIDDDKSGGSDGPLDDIGGMLGGMFGKK